MNAANIITMVRFAMIPFFILFMEIQTPVSLFVAAIIFALASITDKLDGYVAKKYNLVTDIGKIIDPLADKLLVFSAFVLFVSDGLMHPIAFFLVITRELVITSFRVVAASGGRVVGASISGKVKTTVQIVAILVVLVMPLLPEIGFHYLEEYRVLVAQILGWLVAAVTVWSGLDYMLHSLSWKNITK